MPQMQMPYYGDQRSFSPGCRVLMRLLEDDVSVILMRVWRAQGLCSSSAARRLTTLLASLTLPMPASSSPSTPLARRGRHIASSIVHRGRMVSAALTSCVGPAIRALVVATALAWLLSSRVAGSLCRPGIHLIAGPPLRMSGNSIDVDRFKKGGGSIRGVGLEPRRCR
jgi:hypothetical protein